MYELGLTANSSRKLYKQYAEAIENAGGIIVSPDDYEQLEYPLTSRGLPGMILK
jgi:hypothetical protein